ncbi:MAG: DMT family transporter [Rhodospirillales bacterium]|nr:DMT family transporter [Rhodospirillales bacterium]
MSDSRPPAPAPAPGAKPLSFWSDALPAVFVVLWSTGFIGSKMGAPYSEPFTFLAIRFAIAALIMAIIGLMFRATWPNTIPRIFHAIIVGLLVHGVYLGGVFWVIDYGVPAGVAALIVALQPIVIGFIAPSFLGEKVSSKRWFGLVLGFIGVALVVWQQLDFDAGGKGGFAVCVLATLGMAGGALYQKKFCTDEDLRSHQSIQLMAAAIALGALSFLFETQTIEWAPSFIFALGWLTLVMSIGTFTLLYALIRRGAAAQVSSLFYLVPPTVALMAYFLFGETLSALAIVGMLVTVAGVALATKQ